jgi:putative ATP-dependent endonuclease of the OLD family
MIRKISITNYKIFDSFLIECVPDINIVVGDNEAGKSTLLEAINLALTRRLNGRPIDVELTPYLFNKQAVATYLASIRAGKNPPLPRILIELYLTPHASVDHLCGTNNTADEDTSGIRFELAFDEDYRPEYQKLLEDRPLIQGLPIEYYKSSWYGFSYEALSARSIGIRTSYIDATTIRLQNGTDQYLHSIINDGLELKERVGLAMAYRQMKEQFSAQDAILQINTRITERRGHITDKALALGIDLTHKGSWETSLTPHLDDIPFQHIGKGDQNALKIMLALERDDESHVVLIEEPETHLSFTAMNALLSRVAAKCTGKQIFATTHSAFVLNKLGIDKLVFIRRGRAAFLRDLPAATQEYFRKLPGYDTLRLILARKCILVEGPSDELVVQKAYRLRHGKLPIEDGIDVISVRGLSFTRFLDVARVLKVPTIVVADNDGKHATRIAAKFAPYLGADSTIKVFADTDNNCPSLEQQLLRANDCNVGLTRFRRQVVYAAVSNSI